MRVAVVGATGAVGTIMLGLLERRAFPADEIVPFASERSAGKRVTCGKREVVVQDLATFDPAGVDIALFSAGGDTSKALAPAAVNGKAPNTHLLTLLCILTKLQVAGWCAGRTLAAC